MITRALVVEDDDRAMPSVEDTLYSLGHEHRWAQSQDEAQKMLQASQFDYVLMDLEIPAKSGRGGASVQYGLNLAEHIHATKGPGKLPIIVMTGHGVKCLNMVEPLKAAGAVEFIAKPFPDSGRTLAVVIKSVLTRPTAAPAPAKKSTPFSAEKRDLVVHADHVTICGVTVWRETQHADIRVILTKLSQKEGGRYVRIDGRHLGRELGRNPSNPVGRLVKEFRDRVSELMATECSLDCGAEDVIGSGGGGYHLKESVDARMEGAEPETKAAAPRAEVSPVQPAKKAGEPELNERQAWILEQIRKGVHLKRQDIIRHTKKNRSTVNRDIKELRDSGLIATHSDGYYIEAKSRT